MRPASNALVLIVIPSLWVLAAWTVGPYLGKLSLLLIPVTLLGMSLSMLVTGRWLLRRAVRRGLAEPPPPIQWQLARRSRRRLEPVAAPAPAQLPLRTHAAAGLLLAAMVLVAVGMITVLPLGWIWLASQVSSTSAPSIWPYVLVAVGIAASAVLGVRLLAALQRWHGALTGRAKASARPTAWLRSLGDTDWFREPAALVELLVVAIVVAATVLLIVWFFVFADPTRLVPQELQPS